ncbi:MAG: hypothetical protein A3F13_10080 [Gammaproteobacteria bacterium RIFCSPHIGHO2_12_FULL_40_19]|nr:MAG: hypothetical protein A3F13_10080 [Gammaproteobacteria bacterium RIFCSPHIGHO2_12_FULL_40_19]
MHKNRYSICVALLIGLTGLLFFQSATAIAQTKNSSIVTVLNIQGAIGPAVQDYVLHGIKESEKLQAKAIVLTMDTPGGLDTSMRGIIKSILHSPVPVISFVYPSGARAASAGTYILYASHIAAMTPGTNLGAATPVSIVSPEKSDEKNKKENKENASTLKAINDAKAYIRSLAQLRNRNEQWAVTAVTKADSLSATEALKLNVINFVAPSISELLKETNGKIVSINNVPTTINTADATLLHIQPNWRNKILTIMTDPSVAYILLMLGVYGLFFEFMNPGYVAPGVVGAISLLMASYAFQLLPINYAGFTLIVLGIIFMVAESFLPSYGALGLGGIVGFLIGSFLLFDTEAPEFTLPWQLISGVTITTGLFMIGLVQLILRSRFKPVVSGVETMIGKVGIIEKDTDHFWVLINGGRWKATSKDALFDKQTVTIMRVDGLTLIVKAIDHK